MYNTNYGRYYSAGDILSCFFGVTMGIFSLGSASPNIKTVAEGQIASQAAYEIIDRQPRIKIDDPAAEDVGEVSGAIEFKNVTFRYPSRPEQKILDQFSCRFEQGKTTAIVGASGSGKSTIIQLIERFYDPEDGEVLVDGRQI